MWGMSRGHHSLIDNLAILGFCVTVIGTVAGVAALRAPYEGNDAELARGWAATLAQQVKDGEGAVLRQLLGADTHAIDLAYRSMSGPDRAASAPAAGRTFSDTAEALPDILTHYRATSPRRLVITGAAGAGKTVLALNLMLALLEDRDEKDPVPVRIPMAEWDTGLPLRTVLARRLVDAYAWSPKMATGLVEHGLILPVLDGLDEMDPLSEGTPDPHAPRACTALEALNSYQEGRNPGPLILTCLARHYDALPSSVRLVDAARIAITPVTPRDAVIYLRARARDGARWASLVAHLEQHPTGQLAAVLSTPWRLCLTATVYHRTGDPAELLSHATAHELDQYLLARYLPAATATTDNPHRYQPDDIHRWLRELACTLDSSVAPATDIVLHRIRTETFPVRWTAASLAGLSGLALLGLLEIALGFPHISSYSVGIGALIPMIATAAVKSPPARRLPDLRNAFRSTQGSSLYEAGRARLFTHAFFITLAVGGLSASEFEHNPGLLFGGAPKPGFGADSAAMIGWGIGITTGIAYVLISGITTGAPTRVANPRTVIRADLKHSLMSGILVGLITVLPYGLVGATVVGGAAAIGAMLALGITAGASWRYLALVVAARKILPFRLARFLDWAVTAGLLRYSGSAYQFRHRELQQWLTQHPDPISGNH